MKVELCFGKKTILFDRLRNMNVYSTIYCGIIDTREKKSYVLGFVCITLEKNSDILRNFFKFAKPTKSFG